MSRYTRVKPGQTPERLLVVLWTKPPYPETTMPGAEAWGVVRYNAVTGQLVGVSTLDGDPVAWERQSWVEPELVPRAPEGSIPIEAASALVEAVWGRGGWALTPEARPYRPPETAPPRSVRRPTSRYQGPCGQRNRCAYHAGGGPYNEACRTTPPER